MIRALYTVASGMSAQQANLDTVANNLSNSATAGFKGRRLQFEELLQGAEYKDLVVLRIRRPREAAKVVDELRWSA